MQPTGVQSATDQSERGRWWYCPKKGGFECPKARIAAGFGSKEGGGNAVIPAYDFVV